MECGKEKQIDGRQEGGTADKRIDILNDGLEEETELPNRQMMRQAEEQID